MSVEKRICMYTLTIHKDDIGFDKTELFNEENLSSYCSRCFSQNTEIYFRLHNEEDSEEHIHLCCKFKFNEGKTFSRMKYLFPKSHIEECIDFQQGVLYLTHESINAKKENKHIYTRDKIINVYNSDINKYYDSPSVETFDIDKIETYIMCDNMRSILDFGRRFGYSVISSKWKIIQEIKQALLYETKQESEDFWIDYNGEIHLKNIVDSDNINKNEV